jgi:hypothetical protein
MNAICSMPLRCPGDASDIVNGRPERMPQAKMTAARWWRSGPRHRALFPSSNSRTVEEAVALPDSDTRYGSDDQVIAGAARSTRSSGERPAPNPKIGRVPFNTLVVERGRRNALDPTDPLNYSDVRKLSFVRS